MKLHPALSDNERFPLLADLSLLKALRQDSCAPIFNFRSGDRLNKELLKEVKQYAETLKTRYFWAENTLPDWLNEYYQWCRRTVPAYKYLPDSFTDAPTIRRKDIAETQWNFVSNDCNADDLLVYSTSGTTGAPMQVLFDAPSQAAWIPQLQSILNEDGIRIEGGPQNVSICLVCSQQQTLTYASLSTWLDGAGILKINLNPSEWRKPSDRCAFLEKHNPEIITGDPFAFMALAHLSPRIQPKAMVSSAMALSDGLRKQLQDQFKCPVYDIYSLTECRMIAVSRKAGVHKLIRPELYIEILQKDTDQPAEAEKIGEVTISGGINPFLPLIRYRTGDFASLHHTPSGLELRDLTGRKPTYFLNESGQFINNVDISRALCSVELAGFTLHQQSDRSLHFCGWGHENSFSSVKTILSEIFGNQIKLEITIKPAQYADKKTVTYTSAIEMDGIVA